MLFYPLLLLAIVTLVGGDPKCPPLNTVRPCSCQTLRDIDGNDYSVLSCHSLQSEDDLHSVLEQTKGYALFELKVVGSSLRFLPHNAFLNATFKVLSIRDSNISSLSDSNIASKGLDNRLHLIEIINCTYTSSWEWTRFSHLKDLVEIHVSNTELADITEGLAGIQHLNIEAFVLHKNRISIMAEDVFAPFDNLERLALDSNYISDLKRSMFPSPAKRFKILELSKNKLQVLPQNLFYDMPALKSLYLAGNPLTTIDEAVFKPVWDQLHLFLFYGTILSCDCHIKWVTVEDNSKKFIHAECAGPKAFTGRALDSLRPQELQC